jgi:hypothetical protein
VCLTRPPLSCALAEIKTKQNFFDTVALHVGNRPGVLTEDIERKTMGVLKG